MIRITCPDGFLYEPAGAPRCGIIIEDPLRSRRTVTRVAVIDRLDSSDQYDFVLVIVRKNHVAPLLPLLAANSSPNIVFMGNNLSGPEEF